MVSNTTSSSWKGEGKHTWMCCNPLRHLVSFWCLAFQLARLEPSPHWDQPAGALADPRKDSAGEAGRQSGSGSAAAKEPYGPWRVKAACCSLLLQRDGCRMMGYDGLDGGCRLRTMVDGLRMVEMKDGDGGWRWRMERAGEKEPRECVAGIHRDIHLGLVAYFGNTCQASQ